MLSKLLEEQEIQKWSQKKDLGAKTEKDESAKDDAKKAASAKEIWPAHKAGEDADACSEVPGVQRATLCASQSIALLAC